jgi:hypothetical protein
MGRFGAVGLVVWFAVGGVAGAQTAPKAQLISQDKVLDLPIAQGVARVPGGWVLTGRFRILRTDDKLKELKVNQQPIPSQLRAKGYNHVGDIDVVGKYIYAPLEEPNYDLGHQVTARYDVKTLKFVDSVELAQHENGFVTVDPRTMIAYTMDHFDGNALLRYDVRHGWKPLPELVMSATLVHTQGGSVADGFVWISTSNPTNELYRVDMNTGQVEDLGSAGHVGGEGEGIDATKLHGAGLHTLTVDPNISLVWFGHFKVG